MTTAPVLDLARQALPTLANHLWQSTLYLLGVCMVVLSLSRQQARIRYWLWLTATLKFLLPFSLLISLGHRLAGLHQTPAQPVRFITVVEQVSRSFSPATSGTPHATSLIVWLPALACSLWLFGAASVLFHACVRWTAVRAMKRAAMPLTSGREIDALRRAENSANAPASVRLLVCAGMLEPGICGIVRPSLLWPAGITERLDDAQLHTILLHELWHVRRRDNLTALLQMAIEVIFWFHPLVWWLGSRLIAERERACDEAVIESGSDPRVYAESILNASKFCVESPLACVAGVTGSDLKQRMVRIMTQPRRIALSLGAKMCISALGIGVVAAPVCAGLLMSRRVLAAPSVAGQMSISALEQATVRPSQSTETNDRLHMRNGALTFSNVTVRKLILFAYDLKDYQLVGAPAWTDSERYDVQASWQPSPEPDAPAVAPQPPPPPPDSLLRQPLPPMEPAVPLAPGELQAIVKSVLATRFGLRLSSESKDLPGFTLEIAATGSKLPKPIAPRMADDGEQLLTVREMSKNGSEELEQVGPLHAFADLVSQRVKAPVADRTGFTGTYDVTLQWTEAEDDSAAIRTALQQQLGLRLSPLLVPVEVFRVGQVKPPSFD